MSSWNKFAKDPFRFMDNLHIVVKGNNLNFFQKWKRVQYTALGIAVVCAVAWGVFGFDSTPIQFIHVLYEGVPGFIMGELHLEDLTTIYHSYYGKEMHYSAFVIYVGMFYFLSRHYEKMGITRSKNVVYSFGWMFFSVALFEWFWILGFRTFQNQPWAASLVWPQLRIIIQNMAFTIVGCLGALYMWADSFELNLKGKVTGARFWKYRMDWKLFALIGLAVATALFWIYYPGYIEPVEVLLDTGETWQNNRLFPQTLYTIDLDPTDNISVGAWTYVENNMIHLTNTIVKFIWVLPFFYLGAVKKVENKQEN